MARRGILRISAAIVIAAVLILAHSPASARIGAGLDSRLTMLVLSGPGALTVAGQPLDKTTLREFYARRDFALAWDSAGQGLGDRAATVVQALAAAETEGLNPADYHLKEIVALAAADDILARRDRDLLISDGLLHYVSDVAGGRLTPVETDERVVLRRDLDTQDCLALAAALPQAMLADYLAEIPPATRVYGSLKLALARLRSLAEGGGWMALPDGGVLRPGAHDPAIPSLRLRLLAEGLRIGATKPTSDYYDPGLVEAVAEFQRDHALKPDGTIGKDTRAALDMPVEARLRQVAVNMERARWGERPIDGRRVEVNLAAYSLNVYENGQAVLSMPVVIGTKENPTPILASNITAVVLNPNWTLPPAVIKEILPRIRADRDYLAGRGIAREEVEDGKVRLVQPPGPTNPLGRYKFVIPNKLDIYLHDSPDSAKFRYANRAYSHGCVRVGDPAALANLLLDDQMSRFPDGLGELVQAGNTRHIPLLRPVPVSLVYRTAWFDADGRLILGPDGYGRDELLWTAMHKSHRPAKRIVVDHIRSAAAL